MNRTGGAVNATATAPIPQSRENIDVPITFLATDPTTSFAGHLTIQVLLSDGSPLASLEGDITASKEASGSVTVSVPSVTLKAYASGSQLFDWAEESHSPLGRPITRTARSAASNWYRGRWETSGSAALP